MKEKVVLFLGNKYLMTNLNLIILSCRRLLFLLNFIQAQKLLIRTFVQKIKNKVIKVSSYPERVFVQWGVCLLSWSPLLPPDWIPGQTSTYLKSYASCILWKKHMFVFTNHRFSIVVFINVAEIYYARIITKTVTLPNPNCNIIYHLNS